MKYFSVPRGVNVKILNSLLSELDEDVWNFNTSIKKAGLADFELSTIEKQIEDIRGAHSSFESRKVEFQKSQGLDFASNMMDEKYWKLDKLCV